MREVFNQEELENIQKQLFFELGYKVDIYHSEEHRGIIAIPSGKVFHILNIVKVFNY